MAVTIEIHPNMMIAYLSGEIDHHSIKDIREQIDAAAQQSYPQCLYLDFGGVTFMDSSGIGLVMGRYKLMADLGGELKAVNTKSWKPVMKMAGLDKLGVLD